MARPELARPIEGARDALAGLVERYRTVAIVTGRRSDEVAALVDLPHVAYVGLYGLEDGAGQPSGPFDITRRGPPPRTAQRATRTRPESCCKCDNGNAVRSTTRCSANPV